MNEIIRNIKNIKKDFDTVYLLIKNRVMNLPSPGNIIRNFTGSNCYLDSSIHFFRSIPELFIGKTIKNKFIETINPNSDNLDNLNENAIITSHEFCDLESGQQSAIEYIQNFLIKYSDLNLNNIKIDYITNYFFRANLDNDENTDEDCLEFLDYIDDRLIDDDKYIKITEKLNYLSLIIGDNKKLNIDHLLQKYMEITKINGTIDLNSHNIHEYHGNIQFIQNHKGENIPKNIEIRNNESVCKITKLVTDKYIIIHLGIYDNKSKKIQGLSLDITQDISIKNKIYQIISIVLHSGTTIYGGHYINISLRNDGKYYLYNDSAQSPVEFNAKNTSECSGFTPEILLLRHID